MTNSLCFFSVLSVESLCYCVGTGGTNTQRICDFLALSFMFSKFCPLKIAACVKNALNLIWRGIRIILPGFQGFYRIHASIRWFKSWEILIFCYCLVEMKQE